LYVCVRICNIHACTGDNRTGRVDYASTNGSGGLGAQFFGYKEEPQGQEEAAARDEKSATAVTLAAIAMRADVPYLTDARSKVGQA
jgi:hypothetical protein